MAHFYDNLGSLLFKSSVQSQMTKIEQALLLPSNRDKILAIGKIIGRKIPATDIFDNLNDYEKTFIYIDILEGEVTNGGFEQFFFNSSGAFSHEILEAYHRINADFTADIIYNAISLFPTLPVPKDLNIRRQVLLDDASITSLWDDLDHQFAKSDENITELLIDFIKRNISYFN